jgi:hypothetical protein
MSVREKKEGHSCRLMKSLSPWEFILLQSGTIWKYGEVKVPGKPSTSGLGVIGKC